MPRLVLSLLANPTRHTGVSRGAFKNRAISADRNLALYEMVGCKRKETLSAEAGRIAAAEA
jgi:hypothetical protein